MKRKKTEHARKKRADAYMEKATTALKVIYTWATFDEGVALDPQHVANLCKKTLDTHPDKEK